MTVEGLEGRIFFAFNAYIGGAASGVQEVPVDFVFSTTGQAAKQWVIDWGDNSGLQTVLAPDQGTGFTSPHTEPHTFHSPGEKPVTATATSITNVTATAVLAGNSAFGNGGGTGKEVYGLSDAASVGTNIASVVDENNNTYVLSIDGKRMAITRFKPDGLLDNGASGWTGAGAMCWFRRATGSGTTR